MKQYETPCKGPECTAMSVAKGLCSAHYRQSKYEGRMWALPKPVTPEQRFWENVRKDDDGCWRWIGSGSGKFYNRETGEGGYGQLRVNGQSWMAHRWSYVNLAGKYLHPEDTLDHLCRVTRCVNPDHLELVSRGENVGRMNLYLQLRSENGRLREFIRSLGYDPDQL